MSHYYTGTSGYIQQKYFYPPTVKGKDKFRYYVTQFNSVEINSSFYRTPLEKSIIEWKTAAPANFIFTFKVLRYVVQYNHFNLQAFNAWYERFIPFANLHHVMLFQYPASRVCDMDYLSELLYEVPKTFRYAFEFRHPTWFTDDVYSLLKKYNAALVLSDSPRRLTGGRTWPLVDENTADFTFVRFHGSLAMYASGYTSSELTSYAKLIENKMTSDKDVFCYFNNDIFGYAVKNAQQLAALL